MEKFLTRNSALSILAGIFIMAGALWLRLTGSQNAPGTPPAAEPQASQVVYQKSPGPAGNLDNMSIASPENPSVLTYDDLGDKSVLYSGGLAKFSAKDVQKTTDTNRASLLSYGLALTKTINGYPFYVGEGPSEITLDIYRSLRNADNGLLKLEVERAAYESKAEELTALAVPGDLVGADLALANSFNRTSQLISNMEKVQTDKLLALNSARQYVEESKLIITILDRLNAYFKDKNIDIGKDNRASLAIDIFR